MGPTAARPCNEGLTSRIREMEKDEMEKEGIRRHELYLRWGR